MPRVLQIPGCMRGPKCAEVQAQAQQGQDAKAGCAQELPPLAAVFPIFANAHACLMRKDGMLVSYEVPSSGVPVHEHRVFCVGSHHITRWVYNTPSSKRARSLHHLQSCIYRQMTAFDSWPSRWQVMQSLTSSGSPRFVAGSPRE